MNIILIGRTNWLLETSKMLLEKNHKIVGIITAKESSESTVSSKDLRKYANQIGAIYLYSPKLTYDELKNNFDFSSIDIGLSVNYTSIISRKIIELFPLGILNAHGGDLPRYRGNACQAWAIINGEKEIGICVHKMIGGELDSGKIISKSYFPLNVDSRIGEVYEFFDTEIPRLFSEALNSLNEDKCYFLEEQSKFSEDILRCYPRLPIDGKIKWNKDNLTILRLINASSEPYSGAYCNFNNKDLVIWRAKLSNDTEKCIGIPGHVTKICNSGEIIVLTGSGKLIIEEIEFNGYRGKPSLVINSTRLRLF